MVRRLNGRPMWLLIFTVLTAVAVASPAFAQAGGMVRGVVSDEKGEPVEGATVVIQATGGNNRRYEVKSNRRGEFIQIGLSSGPYEITASKEKLNSAPAKVGVRTGQTAEANLVLGVGGAMANAELAAKAEELKTLFQEGVTASNAGRHDEALEKFNQANLIIPNCFDCYNNIGFVYTQKKEYGKAEEAYKRASEIRPEDAAAFNGLANVYNAQRKFDLAAQASAKAAELSGGAGAGAGGGGADAHFNQGVILWNGGKVAEAKEAFQQAIAADPNHAESHFQLGMALVNEGNLAEAATEFETYLKLAPDGSNAPTAKSLVGQLKK